MKLQKRLGCFSPRRLITILFTGAAIVALTTFFTRSASAALILNVSGASGSGVTSWALSGSSTAIVSGTIRTTVGSANFLIDDSFEPDFTGNFLLTSSIQDSVFPRVGTPSITVGADTRTITSIFLDEDGTSRDDVGIRTATSLAYAAGESSSWSGTFTVGLDIGNFIPGTYRLNSTQDNGGGFVFAGVNDVILNFAIVPEPTTVALALLSFIASGHRRRRS